MTEPIVIVGGGFAGFWAALAARRVAGDGPDGVTLVSREPVLQIRPRLYEAEPATLGVDLVPLLATAGVDFVRAEAIAIDPIGHTVGLADGHELPFARLVVATGSSMRRPPIPGASQAYHRQPAGSDRLRRATGRDRPR